MKITISSTVIALVAGSVLFAASVSGQTSSPAPYHEPVIRPGDQLRITVWPDEKLGGEFPVEESGFVYLPILGRVQAAGISLERLRSELRTGYGTAMQNPVVTVTPLVRISVLGAVLRPGLYNVDPTFTLIDVISLAGGFRTEADQSKLRILRGTEVVEVNALHTLESGEPAFVVSLQSGDRIIVPQQNRTFTRETLRTGLSLLQTGLVIANLIIRTRR